MTTETEYVPIADRVRVGAVSPQVAHLDVLTKNDPPVWDFVSHGEYPATLEPAAENVQAAIRLACEAVRKRCAKAIREKCDVCEGVGGCTDSGGKWLECDFCGHPIAAIWGLEL